MSRCVLRPTLILGAIAATGLILTASAALAKVDFTKEPACQSDKPTSQGGPGPIDRDLLVIRWNWLLGRYPPQRRAQAAG